MTSPRVVGVVSRIMLFTNTPAELSWVCTIAPGYGEDRSPTTSTPHPERPPWRHSLGRTIPPALWPVGLGMNQRGGFRS
jgi:hypothetical protein